MQAYRQTVSGGWMLGFLCLAAAGTAAGAVACFLSTEPVWAAWLLVGVSAFFAVLIAAFRSLTLSVDEQGVRAVWGGLVGQRVALADIKAVTVERYRALPFGGWGWRANMKGDRAFSVIGVPDAVVMELQNGRKVWVTLKAPQEAAEAVRSWLKS